MTKIIDGRLLADKIKLDVMSEIVKKKLEPGLAVILVGTNAASQLYVKMKEKACHEVGIEFHKYLMPANVSEKELLESIDFLNQDGKTDAILIQLPLPKKFDEQKIISRIDPAKDVDGFHPQNIKLLLNNQPRLIPGLPLGVLKLLEETHEDLQHKTTVIIAKSPVFTEPMKFLLQQITDAEVTVVAPSDKQLAEKTKQADILITAVGKPGFITKDFIKPNSIIIDIGIAKDETGHTCGDAQFDEVEDIVAHITPVPGGVGPVTVAMLLYNTVVLSKQT